MRAIAFGNAPRRRPAFFVRRIVEQIEVEHGVIHRPDSRQGFLDDVFLLVEDGDDDRNGRACRFLENFRLSYGIAPCRFHDAREVTRAVNHQKEFGDEEQHTEQDFCGRKRQPAQRTNADDQIRHHARQCERGQDEEEEIRSLRFAGRGVVNRAGERAFTKDGSKGHRRSRTGRSRCNPRASADNSTRVYGWRVDCSVTTVFRSRSGYDLMRRMTMMRACRVGVMATILGLLVAACATDPTAKYTTDGISRENGFVNAAGRGDLDAVNGFLASGMSPDARDADGGTALIAAASGGHEKVVDALIAKGANVNVKRESGWNPVI